VNMETLERAIRERRRKIDKACVRALASRDARSYAVLSGRKDQIDEILAMMGKTP
jgi:hypothetical protein